jgi:hypothetical protein
MLKKYKCLVKTFLTRHFKFYQTKTVFINTSQVSVFSEFSGKPDTEIPLGLNVSWPSDVFFIQQVFCNK